MKSLKDIIADIEAIDVQNKNFFMFEIPEVFEFAIRECKQIKAMKLLKVCFNLSLSDTLYVYKSVKGGKSFTDAITNLNINK